MSATAGAWWQTRSRQRSLTRSCGLPCKRHPPCATARLGWMVPAPSGAAAAQQQPPSAEQHTHRAATSHSPAHASAMPALSAQLSHGRSAAPTVCSMQEQQAGPPRQWGGASALQQAAPEVQAPAANDSNGQQQHSNAQRRHRGSRGGKRAQARKLKQQHRQTAAPTSGHQRERQTRGDAAVAICASLESSFVSMTQAVVAAIKTEPSGCPRTKAMQHVPPRTQTQQQQQHARPDKAGQQQAQH